MLIIAFVSKEIKELNPIRQIQMFRFFLLLFFMRYNKKIGFLNKLSQHFNFDILILSLFFLKICQYLFPNVAFFTSMHRLIRISIGSLCVCESNEVQNCWQIRIVAVAVAALKLIVERLPEH